jgi:glycosyltransferase involved in cell wall biosynthesis
MTNQSASIRRLTVPLAPQAEEDITRKWKGGTRQPKVTIICHSYNHEKYIQDALNSFLAQETDFPFEVLVHDDASTDETQEKLKKYQEQYPNIIRLILQTENKLSKGYRPAEFSLPEAKYIALCEGDDFWLSRKKLAVQCGVLDSRPEVNLCFHSAIVADENLKIKKDARLTKEFENLQEFSIEDIISEWFISTQTIVFRRDVILSSLKFFKGIVNGDWSFQLVSAHHGKILFCSNIYACYRKNPFSLSAAIAKNKNNRAAKLIRLFYLFDAYSEFRYRDKIDYKVSEILDEYYKLQKDFECRKCFYIFCWGVFINKLAKKILRLVKK